MRDPAVSPSPPPHHTPVLDQATRLVEAGLSVFPVKLDGSKAPTGGAWPRINGRPSWKPYQERYPTSAELKKWFTSGDLGWCFNYVVF